MSSVEAVGEGAGVDDEEPDEIDDEEEEDGDAPPRRAPWHFKILAVGTVVYLGWRLYQGIGWLIHHVHV